MVMLKVVFLFFLLFACNLTLVLGVTQRSCFTCVVTVQHFRTTSSNSICAHIRRYYTLPVDGDHTGGSIGTLIMPEVNADRTDALKCKTVRNAVWNHLYKRRGFLYLSIAVRPNRFNKPALEICRDLHYCDLGNPQTSFPDVLGAHQNVQTQQQRLSYDAIRFQSITQVRQNVPQSAATIATRVRQSELTISYRCGSAYANFIGQNYYQTGWEHGHLQQYRQIICNNILTGQSRYQKETYGMFYPGPDTQNYEPVASWSTANPMPVNQHGPCQPLFTDGQVGATDDNNQLIGAIIQGTQVVYDKCRWLNDNNNNMGPNLLSVDRPRYAGINLFHFPHTYLPSSPSTYGRCTMHLNPIYKEVSSFLANDAKQLGCIEHAQTVSRDQWYCMSSIDLPTHAVSLPCVVKNSAVTFSENNVPILYNGNDLQAHAAGLGDNGWTARDSQTFGDVIPIAGAEEYPNFEAFIHAKVLWDHVEKISMDFYSVFGDDNEGLPTLRWAADTTNKANIAVQWVWSLPDHTANPRDDGCEAYRTAFNLLLNLNLQQVNNGPNVLYTPPNNLYLKGPLQPKLAAAYKCRHPATTTHYCVDDNNHDGHNVGYATLWARMANARATFDGYLTNMRAGINLGVNNLNLPQNGPYDANAVSFYKVCIVEPARRAAYLAIFNVFVNVAARLPH